MLIDTFVNAVFVYDDKLLLTFNFKDGTRTISLTDTKIAVDKNIGSNLDCSVAPEKLLVLSNREFFSYIRLSASDIASQ